MDLWQRKFVGMFIFKKPVCQYEKTYKILNSVKLRYVFSSYLKDAEYFTNVVDRVELIDASNNSVFGESYLDGTGWIKYNTCPPGRGGWRKMHQMDQLVREHTQVIADKKGDGGYYHPDDILHFRLKPQNVRFLSSAGGFNNFVTAKYNTAGFVA